MTTRRSYDLAVPLHGANPVPLAARVGPLFHTSAIPGKDADTGELPEDPVDQLDRMLANAEAVLDRAEVSKEHIVQATVYLSSDDLRDPLNAWWISCFPDPASRPVRQVIVRPLPFGMACQLTLMAYVTGDG